MKSLVLIGLIVSLAQGAPAVAAEPAAPLLGKWSLDLEHSQIPPDQRPQSVTITYSDVGGGKWNSKVDVIGSGGGEIHATGTYPLDGLPAPSTGYNNVDTVAAKVPAPNVLVMAFYKEGMPRTTRTYTVSTDGKTMSETIVWLNVNGNPEITTNQFTRVP
jgi:hypothetical protein